MCVGKVKQLGGAPVRPLVGDVAPGACSAWGRQAQRGNVRLLGQRNCFTSHDGPAGSWPSARAGPLHSPLRTHSCDAGHGTLGRALAKVKPCQLPPETRQFYISTDENHQRKLPCVKKGVCGLKHAVPVSTLYNSVLKCWQRTIRQFWRRTLMSTRTYKRL